MNIDFSQSRITYLITHEIGNKQKEEEVFLSNSLQYFQEDLEELLLNYFLKPFRDKYDYFSFTHNSNLSMNELYSYSKEIFQGEEDSFIKTSGNIAKHLYEFSVHPKIKKGELIVVKVSGTKLYEETIDLIGVFKSEKKDSFLRTIKRSENINIENFKGINTNKIEKGCLIFNTDEYNGYQILNIDNNQVADYWMNKFLHIKQNIDEKFKTKEIMQMCKNFSEDVLGEKYDSEAKLNFNKDFINYFEDNETFEGNSFIDTVFQDEKLKDDFINYREDNFLDYEFDFDDNFQLDLDEIKQEKKKIKNVIKLDTKLELKVLLDKDNGTKNIEKGFDDEKGMSFYKVYFNEEV